MLGARGLVGGALCDRARPDVVFNAAAFFTDVDRAESETELCWAINLADESSRDAR